jgi:hypothetical protein
MADDESWGFAPPPFNVADAMEKIRRALRDARLAERGNGFELRGRRLVECEPGATEIAVRLARRPAFTPEWDRLTIRGSADVRRFLDTLNQRLRRWQDDDT